MGGDGRRYFSGRCQSALSVGTTIRTVGYRPRYVLVCTAAILGQVHRFAIGASPAGRPLRSGHGDQHSHSKLGKIESPKGDQNLSAATAERYFRCCLGCLGCGEPRRRGSTPTAVHPGVAGPSADPLLVSPRIPNVAAVQELFVDVLAAGLAHLLELLVVGLISQVRPAQ